MTTMIMATTKIPPVFTNPPPERPAFCVSPRPYCSLSHPLPAACRPLSCPPARPVWPFPENGLPGEHIDASKRTGRNSVQDLIGPQLSPCRCSQLSPCRRFGCPSRHAGLARTGLYVVSVHFSLVGPLVRSASGPIFVRIWDLGMASCRWLPFPRTPLCADPMVWFRSYAYCGPAAGIGVPCRSTWKRLPSVVRLFPGGRLLGTTQRPFGARLGRRCEGEMETRMLKRSGHGDIVKWFLPSRIVA